MEYKIELKCCDELKENGDKITAYISADDYVNAIGKLVVHYGQNGIATFLIEPDSPDVLGTNFVDR